MGEGDMSILTEAMRAPKNTVGPIDSFMRSMENSQVEVDEEEVAVKHAMEASLRLAHS